MARTPDGDRLTRRQRDDQLAIRAAAARDLSRLWRAVDPANLVATMPAFVTPAVTVVASRRRQSAISAARYYTRFRAVEGAEGDPPARRLADPVPDDVIAAALRGAGLAGILHARRAGRTLAVATRAGMVRMLGTGTELVLDGGRQTIMVLVEAEP